MDLPSVDTLAAIGVALAGLALAITAARALAARRREAAVGALVAIDAGAALTLRSPRYRLAGRPDEIRRLPDGRLVPIELKTRDAPARGPPPSHRVQLEAYLLLIEETTGRPPPYGLLRYGDGQEFRLPWTPIARAEVVRLRAALAEPYDGRATPSPAKCARCGWREVCDARAPGS
ncbi:MAG TPA: PD-(D/E)XK nuclease family protein [Thermoplasmata archaeon]|nr:PD-(D/E)XK nuclease family protein [Thermoplasmata archaeon]